MHLRPIILMGALVSAGVGFFLLLGTRRVAWLSIVSRDPVIDCPDAVDAGDQEVYSLAVARFRVANRGGKELLLNNIRTSCACTGFERELEGRLVRVGEVRVPSGQGVEITVRQAVNGPAGGSIRNAIYFSTNDPAVPEGRIILVVPRVRCGIDVHPWSIVCGTILAGTPVHHIVEVTDESPNPHQIERVVSSSPDRVSIR
jgi:hypothetical protein